MFNSDQKRVKIAFETFPNERIQDIHLPMIIWEGSADDRWNTGISFGEYSKNNLPKTALSEALKKIFYLPARASFKIYRNHLRFHKGAAFDWSQIQGESLTILASLFEEGTEIVVITLHHNGSSEILQSIQI